MCIINEMNVIGRWSWCGRWVWGGKWGSGEGSGAEWQWVPGSRHP